MEPKGSLRPSFTRAHHPSLFWARSVHSLPPSHFSKIILILSSHPQLSSKCCSLRLSNNNNHEVCDQLFTWFCLRWEVVSISPNPSAREPPLVGCPRMFIQYVRSYPPYMEAVSPSATWGRVMPWWQHWTHLSSAVYYQPLTCERILLNLVIKASWGTVSFSARTLLDGVS
jgi:hypothetical protein